MITKWPNARERSSGAGSSNHPVFIFILQGCLIPSLASSPRGPGETDEAYVEEPKTGANREPRRVADAPEYDCTDTD